MIYGDGDDRSGCARPPMGGLGDLNQRSHDPIDHPSHYIGHPSGVECIQITEHMNFCLGNTVKYIWRAGLKSADPVQDLEKARWYIDREIARLKAQRADAEKK